ncbi:hypothetical protein ACLQ3C_02430 [Gordonia sp. DT30]|uniref:hypothetical protein n=1 Tax=unclassified Gordonia (in: high G+C Gram-positive bacteria) TaxID=2657482 RepID=UPI003CFAC88A
MLIVLIVAATLAVVFWLLHAPDDMNFRAREAGAVYVARANRKRHRRQIPAAVRLAGPHRPKSVAALRGPQPSM